MTYTDAEKTHRRTIIAKAATDAAAHLEESGVTISLARVDEYRSRVREQLASLEATEDTAALDMMAAASVLQIALEMAGVLAPADPRARVAELLMVGADTVGTLLGAGGYKRPTPAQLKRLTGELRARAETLVNTPELTDWDALQADMRATGARVLLSTLGPAPKRTAIN